MKKVYLAGPFFDDEQKAVMKEANINLTVGGFAVIDPQDLSPVIVDLPPEQRTKTLFNEIYARNIQGILDADILVACIDWKDTGTSFELGYAVALGKPTVTFSATGKKANVMLAEATKGHGGIDDLAALTGHVLSGGYAATVVADE